MSNHTIHTVATTEGNLPVYVFGKDQPELPIATDPKVGDIVAVFSRGRYRAVQVSKVGPKRVTVAYTTQGALDVAVGVAQHNFTAQAEANRESHIKMAARYRRQADLIEQFNIEVTSGRKYPDSPFVTIASLPAEYRQMEAKRGAFNASHTTIVNSPAQLREWADSADAVAADESLIDAAKAKDAVPFEQRIVNATHVTTKSVKRSEVYAV